MTPPYTMEGAAEYLGISRSTMSRLIRAKRVRYVRTGRYGGRVLIAEQALRDFLLGEEPEERGKPKEDEDGSSSVRI